ncbi:MAG: PepSY domain-containing protein [Candidatus Bathyarchaeia archaeon]
MNSKIILGVALILVGTIGFATFFILGSYYEWNTLTRNFGKPVNAQYLWRSLTMDEAEQIAYAYLRSLDYENLNIKEIMEFEYNFYIIYFEEDTGMGAFEMLIWKTNAVNNMMMGHMGWGMMAGRITPEPGPNMMWNIKYGGMTSHMGGRMGRQYGNVLTIDMPISEEEAKSIGQRYLDQYFPGSTIMETTKFYGYYTFDFGKDGKIYGMFSVNGYTGQVWLHEWHGTFITMREYEG